MTLEDAEELFGPFFPERRDPIRLTASDSATKGITTILGQGRPLTLFQYLLRQRVFDGDAIIAFSQTEKGRKELNDYRIMAYEEMIKSGLSIILNDRDIELLKGAGITVS